jgi:hypothetical protein
MADSSTTRARRSRQHAAGDHSLCRAERCGVAAIHADSERPPPPSSIPTGLGVAGQELWEAEVASGAPGGLRAVLLLEACRIVDRLETLDRQLKGESWLRFRHDETGVEVTVYVDRVLAEAREQAMALKNVAAELARTAAPVKPAQAKGGGVLADLAAKRLARSAQTAG